MKCKSIIYLLILFIFPIKNIAQIKLIIRGDDAGSTRSANLAIVDNFQNGILRTAEVMVPCPWFNDAVTLINQYPDLDVGVHLTINSEWAGYKWRPLTHCPSLCDSVGNFLANTWGGQKGNSLQHANIDMYELEAELRAQIETAKKRIPQLSHVSEHMVYGSLSADIRNLTKTLAQEYNLMYEGDLNTAGFKPMHVAQSSDYQSIKASFINAINTLTTGNWLWIEHPAIDGLETQGMKFSACSPSVATARNNIYLLFSDPEVKEAIKAKNIELIAYDYFLSIPKSIQN